MPLRLPISKMVDISHAFCTSIHISDKHLVKWKYAKIDSHFIYTLHTIPIEDSTYEECDIFLSKVQRDSLSKKEGELLLLEEYTGNIDDIHSIDIEVQVRGEEELELDTDEFIKEILKSNKDFPLNYNQVFSLETGENTFRLRVKSIEPSDFGLLKNETTITLESKSPSLIFTGRSVQTIDLESLGIGGLKNEFSEMFRRAFIQKTVDKKLMRKLGVDQPKGLMLYGPPGTGKTLTARQIGSLLSSRKPKIVNGPEILNKYVGQSEENIRALFKEAEIEFEERGEDSLLHIIIFDEIDAICKQRSSTSHFGDQIVNQLLSKMDGVERLNNILIIGLTNRIDLIDSALLRPGRFEIKIEVGLPSKEDRVEIFNIHTKSMRRNKLLSGDVNSEELAERSENFTGAEITAVVKSAISFGLQRDLNSDSVEILREDFIRALDEIQPAFGATDPELTLKKPYYIFPSFEKVISRSIEEIRRLERTKHYDTFSLLLHGPKGVGKSRMAAKIAIESKIPFVKIITPKRLIGKSEIERINYLKNIFNDGSRSSKALIILDDIENIIDYVGVGPRFSNPLLQALKIFIRDESLKVGHKIFVIGTTSEPEVCKELDLIELFDDIVEIPLLNNDDVDILQKEVGGQRIELKEPMVIKQVLGLIEE